MKKSVAALAGLAAFAPAALAAPSHFLKVTPGQTSPGKAVTISGSVDRGCQIGHRGDAATIYSNAFKGATKQSFAGVPAVSAALAETGGRHVLVSPGCGVDSATPEANLRALRQAVAPA